MTSAGGHSIAGQLALYQPAVSRRVGKSIFGRQGPAIPIPENIPRPPALPYPTHGRRALRSRPATQQRSQRIDMLSNAASRYANLSAAQPQRERWNRSNPVHATEIESKTSSNAVAFSARRSHRTRYTSGAEAVDATVDSKSRRYGNEIDGSHHSQVRRKGPGSEFHISCPPSPSINSIPRHLSSQASNRWSFSSDSSTSSTTSWSSSSPTFCSSASSSFNPPWSCPYAKELEKAQRERELWRRRCLDMEEAFGWMVESPSTCDVDDETFTIYRDDDNEDSRTTEEDDVGQTTVHSSYEVIAQDSRFASSHQRTRNLDGTLVMQRPSEEMSNEKWASRTAGQTEWKKMEEERQRKRARAFPVWAESVPRHMQGKQHDGIRFRFGHDSDVPSPQSVARTTRHAGNSREQPAATRSRFPRQNSSRYNVGEPSRTPR